jgi:hypothetical protein
MLSSFLRFTRPALVRCGSIAGAAVALGAAARHGADGRAQGRILVRRRADRPAAHWSRGKRSPTSSRSRSSPAKTRSSPALGLRLRPIQAALAYNERGGKVRGASTLSQQVSKNLFLWSGRSWLRKGLEAWFTALIEVFWPKQRILEVYLNSVEWGKGVFGAQAAARITLA